jgi:hypothetical protein
MSYVEMTEIAGGARALTNTELSLVCGGNIDWGGIAKDVAGFLVGLFGGLAAGKMGGTAGAIAARETVGAIIESNNYGGMTANYF